MAILEAQARIALLVAIMDAGLEEEFVEFSWLASDHNVLHALGRDKRVIGFVSFDGDVCIKDDLISQERSHKFSTTTRWDEARLHSRIDANLKKGQVHG